MAVPTRDEDLVPYSTNWNTRLLTGYATFDLTVEQSTALTNVHTPYVTAYTTMTNARQAGVRSTPLVLAKDQTKTALLAVLRQLYTTVQANPNVSDSNKGLLGITIRNDRPRPVPAPTQRPAMRVASTFGRTLLVDIYDPTRASKRGRAPNASQALVYSYVGTSYPSDPTLWQFCGTTSTCQNFNVTFPDTTPNGAQVWLCAAWANRRGDTSPVSVPITTNLQYAGSGETQTVKLAA